MCGVVCVDVADEDHIDVGGSDELVGAGRCLRCTAAYFLFAMIEGLGRQVAEVGDLVVVRQMVQDVNVGDLIAGLVFMLNRLKSEDMQKPDTYLRNLSKTQDAHSKNLRVCPRHF